LFQGRNDMRLIYTIGLAALALSMTGCALTTGIRFGDDGSVSKPEIHGSVQASGTVAGR